LYTAKNVQVAEPYVALDLPTLARRGRHAEDVT
jgi:hypothetical protein